MEGEKGKDIKRKAIQWKTKAEEATCPGDSSYQNLVEILKKIIASKQTNKNSEKLTMQVFNLIVAFLVFRSTFVGSKYLSYHFYITGNVTAFSLKTFIL